MAETMPYTCCLYAFGAQISDKCLSNRSQSIYILERFENFPYTQAVTSILSVCEGLGDNFRDYTGEYHNKHTNANRINFCLATTRSGFGLMITRRTFSKKLKNIIE